MKKIPMAFLILGILMNTHNSSFAVELSGSSAPSEMSWQVDEYVNASQSDILIRDNLTSAPWEFNVPNSKRYVFPPCQSVEEKACIVSVEGRIGSNPKWEPLSPLVKLHANPARVSVYNTALPDSNFPMIWKSTQDLSTKAGNEYLVTAFSDISNRVGTGIHFGINPILRNFQSNNSAYCPNSYKETPCIRIFNHPENAEYRMKIRLGGILTSLTPWLNARISDLAIQIENQNGIPTLTVSGKPMLIPSAHAIVSKEILMKNYPGLKEDNFVYQGRQVNIRMMRDSYAYFDFQRNIGYFNDKSYGELSAWHFDSVNGRVTKCFKEGSLSLGGVLVSNAAAAVGNPPSWDESASALTYLVASPHFLSSGAQHVGVYDVIIKQSLAECFWGKKLNSAVVMVSIVNNSGESQVSTSTSYSRNGYFYFHISGFHYSASSISISFRQPQLPKEDSSAVKIESNLICVRGKVIKKIQGSNPKCPIGFKIKN